MPSLSDLRDQALSELKEAESRHERVQSLLEQVRDRVLPSLPTKPRIRAFCFEERRWKDQLNLMQASENHAWDVDCEAVAETMPDWFRFQEMVEERMMFRHGFEERRWPDFSDCVVFLGLRGLDVVVRLVRLEEQMFSVERYTNEATDVAEAYGVPAVVERVRQFAVVEKKNKKKKK